MNLLSTQALMALPEPSWLIERLYPTGGFVVLYGPSGHGKSFIALDWALHVATGKPWQGLSVQQGPVIYVAAEGRGGMSQRVSAWLQYHNCQNPPLLFSLEPLDMFTGGPEELIGACQEIAYDPEEEPAELQPVLIILDTLACCFGTGDENETSDMTRFTQNVDMLRAELHATVVVVHHLGKDRNRGERGSSALRGAASTMIRVSRVGESIGIDPYQQILLRCTKQKDAVDFDDIELRLVPTAGSCLISPMMTTEQALKKALTSALPSDRERAKLMADLTGLSPEQCRHRIRAEKPGTVSFG